MGWSGCKLSQGSRTQLSTPRAPAENTPRQERGEARAQQNGRQPPFVKTRDMIYGKRHEDMFQWVKISPPSSHVREGSPAPAGFKGSEWELSHPPKFRAALPLCPCTQRCSEYADLVITFKLTSALSLMLFPSPTCNLSWDRIARDGKSTYLLHTGSKKWSQLHDPNTTCIFFTPKLRYSELIWSYGRLCCPRSLP